MQLRNVHVHPGRDGAEERAGRAITWSSKKQPIIALSMTEAEYIAAAHATKEAMWLRTFVGELMMPLSTLTTIFCDNQVAIALSKGSQYHARTKHIDIRFHFIREAVENSLITLVYCPTKTMTADLLTKPLNCSKMEEHTYVLGLLPV